MDLAVVAMPASKIKHEIHPLTKDEIYLVVPKYHPVMKKTHDKPDGRGYWIDLKDTVEYPYILSGYYTILGRYARKLFKQQDLTVHVLHDNITARMAASMAMEGLGLSFTYASCIGPGEKYELLSIGEEGVFLDLGIAYPTNEYHPQSVLRMEDVIREVYQSLDLSHTPE